MNKKILIFAKFIIFSIFIIGGFLLSNHKAALAEQFNDNLICDWENQAKIVCKFGGGLNGVFETTWDLYYEPTNSRNENTPVFKVNKENGFLTFTSPTQATLREGGREQQVSVENTSQATIKGNESECGIIQPNGPCDGGGDVADGFTGTGLNTEAFINGIKEQQEKEAALSQCENNKGIPLQFITCPLLDGINNTVGALIGGDEQIDTARQGLLIDFLKLPPINAGETGSVLSQVVGNVVNIANIFYILIFIILIFASSIPFLNLDSYTIKKTLPKFIAAVILTQFSIQICGIIVDFFNLLGLAIPNVIFGLISGVSFPPGGGVAEVGAQVGTSVALVAGAGALVGVVAFAPVIIIILAIMALVAALTAVFYIMVRFFLLYVMIIISPLAFAAWVLPGTEKFFKQWWTNFIKLNAMFVTIMGLLSISILLSLIFRSLGSDGGNTVTTLLSGVIPIIALILVPKTLKWTTQGMNALAAGALNAVGGAGSKAAKSGKQQVQKGEEAAKNRLAATNFGANTRLGRGLTAGAGGFFNTKGAQRNIANRANKVRNERAAQVQYDYNNFSAATNTEIAKMKSNNASNAEIARYKAERAKGLVKRAGSDTYSRQALMASAAQAGDTATLRELQGNMSEQEWNAGVNANYSAFDGVGPYKAYDSSYQNENNRISAGSNTLNEIGKTTYGDLLKMSGGLQGEIAKDPNQLNALSPQVLIDAHSDKQGRNSVNVDLRKGMRENADYVVSNSKPGSEAHTQAQSIISKIDNNGNWID